MKRQGAEIVDPADVPNVKELGDPEFEVLLYEFKSGLEAYLASLGEKAPVRTLAGLIAFNERTAEREMPYFGQELFLKAQEKGPLTTPALPRGAREVPAAVAEGGPGRRPRPAPPRRPRGPDRCPAWVIDR